MATLGRAHADRGETLDQLDVAVTDLGGVDDIAHLQVFIEVDEVLAFGMRKNGPWEVDLSLSTQRCWRGDKSQL
ncbi:hypothetical protein D3C85_1745690 [compost metagenome]